MFLGSHDVQLNITRSVFAIARSLWYSPALYLTVARLFC